MRPESEAVGTRSGADILPFEQMLADLSAGFVHLPAERVDGAITDALRRIVELLGADRCNLIRFSADAEPRVTHTWSAEGIPAVVLRSISSDFFWAMARIRAGDAIVAGRLDRLPLEAAVDVATWRRAGVQSNLTVPMNHCSSEGIAAMQDLITMWRQQVQLDDDARRLGAAGPAASPLPAVEFSLVNVSFNAVADPRERECLQNLPTSFALTDEAVDRLRAAAAQVLRESPAFQRFVTELSRPQ